MEILDKNNVLTRQKMATQFLSRIANLDAVEAIVIDDLEESPFLPLEIKPEALQVNNCNGFDMIRASDLHLSIGKLIAITTLTGSILSLSCNIPYVDVKSKKRKVKQFGANTVNPYLYAWVNLVRNWASPSPSKFLESARTLDPQCPENSMYNPILLDDPDLKVGRHKTVITLPFFLGSIIQPSKPVDIKRELNEHFKETHPTIDASITLSQIRNLKASLLEVAIAHGIEFSSLALSYCYFEKLVLKNAVNKVNRRLTGAVCLLLAAKVNDPKELNYASLLLIIEKILDISPKDVYAEEFSVYAALEFTLFLPLWDIQPHLDRILAQTEFVNLEGYLGNASFYLELPEKVSTRRVSRDNDVLANHSRDINELEKRVLALQKQIQSRQVQDHSFEYDQDIELIEAVLGKAHEDDEELIKALNNFSEGDSLHESLHHSFLSDSGLDTESYEEAISLSDIEPEITPTKPLSLLLSLHRLSGPRGLALAKSLVIQYSPERSPQGPKEVIVAVLNEKTTSDRETRVYLLDREIKILGELSSIRLQVTGRSSSKDGSRDLWSFAGLAKWSKERLKQTIELFPISGSFKALKHPIQLVYSIAHLDGMALEKNPTKEHQSVSTSMTKITVEPEVLQPIPFKSQSVSYLHVLIDRAKDLNFDRLQSMEYSVYCCVRVGSAGSPSLTTTSIKLTPSGDIPPFGFNFTLPVVTKDCKLPHMICEVFLKNVQDVVLLGLVKVPTTFLVMNDSEKSDTQILSNADYTIVDPFSGHARGTLTMSIALGSWTQIQELKRDLSRESGSKPVVEHATQSELPIDDPLWVPQLPSHQAIPGSQSIDFTENAQAEFKLFVHRAAGVSRLGRFGGYEELFIELGVPHFIKIDNDHETKRYRFDPETGASFHIMIDSVDSSVVSWIQGGAHIEVRLSQWEFSGDLIGMARLSLNTCFDHPNATMWLPVYPPDSSLDRAAIEVSVESSNRLFDAEESQDKNELDATLYIEECHLYRQDGSPIDNEFTLVLDLQSSKISWPVQSHVQLSRDSIEEMMFNPPVLSVYDDLGLFLGSGVIDVTPLTSQDKLCQQIPIIQSFESTPAVFARLYLRFEEGLETLDEFSQTLESEDEFNVSVSVTLKPDVKIESLLIAFPNCQPRNLVVDKLHGATTFKCSKNVEKLKDWKEKHVQVEAHSCHALLVAVIPLSMFFYGVQTIEGWYEFADGSISSELFITIRPSEDVKTLLETLYLHLMIEFKSIYSKAD